MSHEEQWREQSKAIAMAWLDSSEGQMYLASVRNEEWLDGYDSGREDEYYNSLSFTGSEETSGEG